MKSTHIRESTDGGCVCKRHTGKRADEQTGKHKYWQVNGHTGRQTSDGQVNRQIGA